ncbi:MAG: phosphoglycerate kinase [Parcubacteria group bacterium]|nr:phosphoglycerate kinase [Parcubacteria group bacterium]
MNLRRYTREDIEGKRVLLRADVDVGAGFNARFEHAAAVVRELLEYGASHVVLAGHRGRPDGRPNPEFSLADSAERLGRELGREIRFVADIGENPADYSNEALIMLENTRFWPGEESNDPAFARMLAQWGEVYVNDAFGASHRNAASITGIPATGMPSFAGPALVREVRHLEDFITTIKHPFVAVLGGAKIETKLPLITKLLELADAVLVGGALANTLLAGGGAEVGASLVERDFLAEAGALESPKLILPVDAVMHGGDVVEISAVGADGFIGDIGPKTLSLFREKLAAAQTILWNGPMGKFEEEVFRSGTTGLATAIAESRATTLVGGGDTVEAITALGFHGSFGFISSGGGAMLAFLAGARMPGLRPLLI